MDWVDHNKQEQEQERPVPPYTKVTAVRDFEAQHPHDLPFSRGEQLTVLEPCNVIFWYLAEDSLGRRGVVPINFVKVESSEDNGGVPAPPLPARSDRHRTFLPPPEPTPPPVPSATLPAQQMRRKLSPQTIPRSAATTLHTQLSHTSSLGRTVRDSSSDPPPPLPSKPQLFPKPAKLPPPVHPRSKPPLQAAASVESSRNGAFPTAGVKVQKSRPIPLNPSPGLKTQGAHFSGPPIPSENQKSHIPLSQPPGVENQRSHVPSNRPLGTETQCPPRAPIDINNRPPAPLPPEALVSTEQKTPPISSPPRVGKYTSSQEFIQKSGWFQPSVEAVLCRKSSLHLPVFQTMTNGIYVVTHKAHDAVRYVGKSRNIYSGMIQMFHRLYERPENKLNPFEMELKYNYPNADEWYMRLVPVINPERLDLEQAKLIAHLRSVQPEGLNQSLEFHSREEWYEFAAWYKSYLERNKKLGIENEVII